MEKHTSPLGWVRYLTAAFALLSGVYLTIGGIWLISVGGTPYYVIAGLALLVTALLIHKRRAEALTLYAALLIGSMVWGVWEVGSDFWALAPRCDVLVIFGIWLLLPFVRRACGAAGERPKLVLGASLVVSVLILAYAVFHDPQEINGTLPASTQAPAGASAAAASPAAPSDIAAQGVADGDWPAYGRTQAGTRYSPLRQIDGHNVRDLQVAWTFRTGDKKRETDPGELTDEVTPIKVGDMLYLCSPHQILFALDAATGKRRWTFDPGLKTDPTFQHVTCRGVSYHETAAAAAAAATGVKTAASQAVCARRVILPVNDGRLFELDAATGERCPGFGNHGELDLQHAQPGKPPASRAEPGGRPQLLKPRGASRSPVAGNLRAQGDSAEGAEPGIPLLFPAPLFFFPLLLLQPFPPLGFSS